MGCASYPSNAPSSTASSEAQSGVDSLGDSASSLDSSSSSLSKDASPSQSASWELTYLAIPATPQSKYNEDFDFEVTDELGGKVTFHGDLLQRGAGSKDGVSIDNTIQMKKTHSYFYMTSGQASSICFSILDLSSAYGDFSGTPSIFVGDETLGRSDGTKIALTPEKNEDAGTVDYAFEMPQGASRFRFENASSNAIYLTRLSNLT